ncbi:MAG: phosphoenolpyruvate--protein phosphotransferase [Alkalispirochaeta sp.]
MSTFDGLALIHAVTELSELLGRGSTLDQFLTDLVTTVADQMKSQVCSIYLYDVEQNELVLRATNGLNPGLVGEVRLGADEGLTGAAFTGNTAIIERDVNTSGRNKAIPDLGEEQYPMFIGVPIKRNNLGIGVLTLQYADAEGMDEQVPRALRAIASHLAVTLENAAALYELREGRRVLPTGETGRFESGLIQGTSASRGIAMGRLEYLDERRAYESAPVQRSLSDAIDLSTRQLQELQRQVDRTLSDVAAMIFSSHLLMLSDDSFVGKMIRLNEEHEFPPVEAVQTVVEEFCRRFMAIPDPRFQEKAQDVQDLGNRIIHNIENRADEEGDYHGHVIAAHEIFPSELVKLFLQNVEGVIFSGGSATGHVAILAQSLDLPLVATADHRLFSIPIGTEIVVDAEEGKIVVGPTREVRSAYAGRAVSRKQKIHETEPIESPVSTLDGAAITLSANVNLIKDAREARCLGADGIGLYRSEIPFLIRNGFPTEDEQVTVYRRVVEEFPEKPVRFRTLDIGGDKLLSSQIGREDNPFLGYRGIRFLLGHREILRDQLRAMLRAGFDRDIGIQFPMVGNMEEFLTAREEVLASIQELQREGIPCTTTPKIGVMIELPSAVEIVRELAECADFLSIGSNDLIMYMLAVDRTNHRVADLYRKINPAVLRAIKRVRDAAAAAETPLSVCGADAADPAMALFYIGIGIDHLSVDPGNLPRLARFIAAQRADDARHTAEAMLSTSSRGSLQRMAEEIRNGAQQQPGISGESVGGSAG